MSHTQSNYHDRISMERFDDPYSDVLEREYNHYGNVTSPFDIWSVCKLRSKCNLGEAQTTATDVVVWGRGSGPHPATTRVGGAPVWNPERSLPSGLRFFGQFNLLDSTDVLPFSPKGILSVWVSEDFPWNNDSVKTFWIDPESAILSTEFKLEHGFLDACHEPYFGSLCRSWDPNPNEKIEPVAVDHQFERCRKYSPRQWNATKYGGIEYMPQWGSEPSFGWHFLFQFASIQASPSVLWPWTTREEHLNLNFDKDGIHHDSNHVILGDMGVISFSGTRSGTIRSLFECG